MSWFWSASPCLKMPAAPPTLFRHKCPLIQQILSLFFLQAGIAGDKLPLPFGSPNLITRLQGSLDPWKRPGLNGLSASSNRNTSN